MTPDALSETRQLPGHPDQRAPAQSHHNHTATNAHIAGHLLLAARTLATHSRCCCPAARSALGQQICGALITGRLNNGTVSASGGYVGYLQATSGTRTAVHTALRIATAGTNATHALDTCRRRDESKHHKKGLQRVVRLDVLASHSSVRVEATTTAPEARSEHTCRTHCFFTRKWLRSPLRRTPYGSLRTRSVGSEARPTSAGKLCAMRSHW